MKKSILILLILSNHYLFCQNNEFKIGVFGFSYMSNSNWYCQNLGYSPRTDLLFNGHPTSMGNVLSADGFNIVTNYEPNCYLSSITGMSGLLQLIKNNNLKYMTHTRLFYKPNITGNPSIENGTNVYDFSQNPLSLCQARPNFNNLFSTNLYASINYKDVVWGHQITEEASYRHGFNPTNGFLEWNSNQNIDTEIPVQNISDAISYFRQRLNGFKTKPNQKLVVMEAYHGHAIWENAIEGTYQNPINNFQPNDYLKMTNVSNPSFPDVFLEGSYFHFPESNWMSNDYNMISTNDYNSNGHYLGGQKSIDWAYTHVNDVQDVIGTEINCEDCKHQYHSNLNIPNANWLWFQAYTSIIHGAKGIWFWDLSGSYVDVCEKKNILINNSVCTENYIINKVLENPALSGFSASSILCDNNTIVTYDDNGNPIRVKDYYSNAVNNIIDNSDSRFERPFFSDAYRNFISQLSKELAFLKGKDILSTVPTSVISVKKDFADPNNIIKNYSVPTWPLNATYDQIVKHSTNEYYTLRYTIRSSGEEVAMIVSNPLGCSVLANLDFSNFSNDIIRNSKNYSILFESAFPILNEVNSLTYKTSRISNIDLDNLTVGKTYSADFSGIINNLAWGPVDVHVFKFGPISNQWFDESIETSSNTLQLFSEITSNSDCSTIYFVNSSGTLHMIYKLNNIWHTDWLNGNAPKVLQGTGLGKDFSTNDIFYASVSDKKVYRMYYTTNGWQYEKIDNSTNNVRADSRIIYSQGNIFYVREDGKIHNIYKVNGNWVTDWLNSSAPTVKAGIGMTIAPDWNCPIYYQGSNGLIYNLTWNNQWIVSTIYNSAVDIRQNSELHYGNGQIFFIKSDGTLHVLYKNSLQNWTIDWLNGNAPKVKSGTDFALSTNGGVNTIYYIGTDNFIYELSWSSQNGWQYQKISPTPLIKGRDNVDVFICNNKVYYGGSDTKVHSLYYVGSKKMEHDDNIHDDNLVFDSIYKDKLQLEDFLEIYPNPATNEINLNYTLTTKSKIQILIFDLNGKQVETIFDGEQDADSYSLKFTPKYLISGIYFVNFIDSNLGIIRKKIIYQK